MSTAQLRGNGRRTEASKLAAEADALRQLRAHTTVSIKVAAAAVGVGRDGMRLAVERGEVAAIRLGAEFRVCSAPLLAALGLGPKPIPAVVASQTEGDGS